MSADTNPPSTQPTGPADDAGRWKKAASEFSHATAQSTRVAVGNTLAAFRLLMWNPAGNLSAAFDKLGPQKSMQAGIVCAVAYALARLLAQLIRGGFAGESLIRAQYVLSGRGLRADLAAVVCGLAVALCLITASFVARLGLRGKGRVASDVFLAGVALAPVTLAILLATIFGPRNDTIQAVVMTFGDCLLIVILFHGLVDLCHVGRGLALYAVPAALLFAGFVSGVVGRAFAG